MNRFRRTPYLGLNRIARLQRAVKLVAPILGRWPRLLHFAPSALRNVMVIHNVVGESTLGALVTEPGAVATGS